MSGARSRFGYALCAIKADEEAAAVMGIHTTRCKILAWALSALSTGLVGGIYAYWLKYIEPPFVFDILISGRPRTDRTHRPPRWANASGFTTWSRSPERCAAIVAMAMFSMLRLASRVL